MQITTPCIFSIAVLWVIRHALLIAMINDAQMVYLVFTKCIDFYIGSTYREFYFYPFFRCPLYCDITLNDDELRTLELYAQMKMNTRNPTGLNGYMERFFNKIDFSNVRPSIYNAFEETKLGRDFGKPFIQI